MSETLQSIIDKLWIASDDAEWTPKTDTLSGTDLHRWFTSDDIEVLGFANAMMHDARFRIEPPLTPGEYKDFVMHYYGRRVTEDPQGTWADSRYSAGGALVNVFASLWRDARVPRDVTTELKEWLARLYINGDENVRTALVTACFEHLFEQRTSETSLLIGRRARFCRLLTRKRVNGTRAAAKLPWVNLRLGHGNDLESDNERIAQCSTWNIV